MADRVSLLILGLGNLLCTDDGLGAAAVSRLSRHFELPDGAVAVEGGTLGLALLPYFEQARTVIMVDAIQADAPPGSLVRLEGDDVQVAVLQRLSVHQVGVADLLQGARWIDQYPSRVILLGVVPASTELGFGCSAAVGAALPRLVDAVVDEARQLGYVIVPRAHDAPLVDDPGDLARLLSV